MKLRSPDTQSPAKGNSSAQTRSSDWVQGVAQDTKRISRRGYTFILGALVLFLGWAVWAPLSSAVVSNGRIIAAGQNKLLQHPTGGVVKAIHAKDGQRLKRGDVVVEIAPEASRAELAQLKARHQLLSAQEARFEAEKRSNEQGLQQAKANQPRALGAVASPMPRPKPDDLGQQVADQPEEPKQPALELEQMAEFNARMTRFSSELSSLQNQYAALRNEYEGLGPQVTNQRELVTLKKGQVDRVRPLLKDQYIAKAKVLEMETDLLSTRSKLDALLAQRGATKARMAEIQDRISQLQSSRIEEYSRELTTIRSELAGISEQIKAAEKALSYTQIKAPVDGTLVKLSANTIGGVIARGETFGEIVPSDGGIVVEAKIQPQDIASIKLAQEADIVITAFNRRLVDPFPAKVTYVAADSSIDEVSGEPYFAVKLAMDDLSGLEGDIQPGMYAETYIQLESRSFLAYLMKPLNDSFRKAFQER